MENQLTQSILIALFVGLASGAVGSFIILKRMALVGDALSHVALPGIALALFYHFDPFWGVIAFLLIAVTVVWWLESKTSLPADALVGLLFTASLAVGILAIPNSEILESLLGGLPQFSVGVFTLVVAASIFATALVFIFTRQFLFQTAAADLARVSGLGRGYGLLLLLVFAFVVSLGIKLVGTLLMGALTIIPASIAKNISGGMRSYLLISTILGGLISVVGVILAEIGNFPPGPSIILLGIVLFLLSLFFRRIK